MSMKEELAALKKKRDAGDITAFKFRQGTRRIKNKYGVDAPSNVGKIVDFISRKVGPAMTAKGGAKAAAAKKKAAEQTARSDRQLIAKARNERAKQTPRAGTPTKRAAPKFNPSLLKMPTKSMEKQMLAKSDKVKDTKSKAKSSGKTWKDFKSVSAAQKAGLNYFTGSDGKKKIAITAEQLKKKGMSLRKYANSLKGKK